MAGRGLESEKPRLIPGEGKAFGFEDLPLHAGKRKAPPFFSGVGYVAWLDILGFKQWLGKDTISIVQRLQTFDLAIEQDVMSLADAARIASPHLPPEGLCNVVRFADTVVIYSNDSTPKGFSRVVRAASAAIHQSLVRGLPLRGAIAGGEIYIDPSAMFFAGAPLLEAHSLAESQEWAGAIVSPELARDKTLLPMIEFLRQFNYLVWYRAPQKTGIPCPSCGMPAQKAIGVEHLCVNWARDMQLDPRILYVFWNERIGLAGRESPLWDKKALQKADATVKFGLEVARGRHPEPSRAP